VGLGVPEHWVHLKTTNPIESTFAIVRLRTDVTKGPGSRTAGLAMAYKLLEAAQQRWRAVNGPHLVPLVRAGATFHKGQLVERPIDITEKIAKGRRKAAPRPMPEKVAA
jgi:putative transposase